MNSRIPRYAAAQSVTEISIGSLVHALHIPLGGHLLSLNQALLLTFATKGLGSRREGVAVTSGIANVAAVLKSLSPAGKRLSPMLAISMQGMLYALGVGLGGATVFGAVLGTLLLALWAFVHPLLMAYFVFGSRLFEAIEKLWTGLAHKIGVSPEAGIWILAGAVSVKLAIGSVLALAAWFSPVRFESRYIEFLRSRWSAGTAPPGRSTDAASVETAPAGAGRALLRDLMNPLFICSLVLSVGFFVLGQDATAVEVVLYLLRITAAALIVFAALRFFPFDRVLKRFPQLRETAAQIARMPARQPGRPSTRGARRSLD